MDTITATKFEGVYLIKPPIHQDSRGVFVKPYNSEAYIEKKIITSFDEYYYSHSKKGVIRGMHFQNPPNDHAKLVSVLNGSILDVIVDLRKESKTYLMSESFELSQQNSHSLYIPSGFAHGFLSEEDNTIVSYLVSSCYSSVSDDGILYSSISFNWPIENPNLSERDSNFTTLQEFDSPF
ncbi:MAG: dTDP-4-dehydrorhamnose 3,5-epimerase family protein [Candidatus Cloacimonetes bacterium]|nr:dTDP-4-dehydrorhamnose 3,5-epimerase family protein [Candidatus Cloacimonadota bacterium]